MTVNRALPVCGSDDRLKGMVTDRDIVVECLAREGDPATAHRRWRASF